MTTDASGEAPAGAQAASRPARQPERVSDGALRAYVGYNMKRAYMMLRADLARTLEPHGLRLLTFTALTLIADNPGLSQSQLAQAMAIERPNLVALVDELEARGVVTRDRVPTDRRAYALNVTAQGARVLAAAARDVAAREADFTAVLDPGEAARLVAALNSMETAHQGKR